MTPAPLMPMADFVRDVQFASARYTRHLVHKDHDVDLLVLCWARGAVAPIYGHEGEYCWARVERGQLTFWNYREISRTPLKLEALGGAVDPPPGQVDGPADIHSVSNPLALGEDAISVHVYPSPRRGPRELLGDALPGVPGRPLLGGC